MSPSRRRYLALATASLAGCLDRPGGPPDDTATPNTDAPDTDTPTPSPTATPEPASFRIEDLSVPDAATIGQRLTVAATVRNVGGQAGKAAVPLTVDRGDGNWKNVGTLRTDTVQPGQAAVVEGPALTPSTLPELRLRAGDRQTTVSVEPPVLAVGEPFSTRAGVAVEVTGISFAPSYEYHVDGDARVAEATPGWKWAMVEVEVDNPTDSPVSTPTYEEFGLLRPLSGTQYDPAVDRNEVARYRGGALLAGADRAGRMVFEVPDGVRAVDLRIAWSRTYGDIGAATVYWEPS
jgi:hypothetical protein